MSNSHAIAAVTSMLDYLITQGADASSSIEKVTTQPPDKARKPDASDSQINIFLYQTAPNAAWRNMDMPGRTRPGETGTPPLALNLYYLITAYGKDDNDISAHELLGHAMQMLHDHSTISRADIEAAAGLQGLDSDQQDALSKAELHNQVEQLHITPLPLPLEELSRLWSTFQTPYRVSAAYEVSVVLIESARPVKAPLPVLAVGPGDAGISVQTHLIPLIPGYPQLDRVVFPDRPPSLRSGETLILEGAHLAQDGCMTWLQFKHPHMPKKNGHVIQIDKPLATKVEVKITDSWWAGFYTVTAQVKDSKGAGPTSNALSFAHAPNILRIKRDNRNLIVRFEPALFKGQQASLLLGDRELLPPKHTDATRSLTFQVPENMTGDYCVRLRVDGVDSHVIDYSKTPPVFYDDDTHKVSL